MTNRQHRCDACHELYEEMGCMRPEDDVYTCDADDCGRVVCRAHGGSCIDCEVDPQTKTGGAFYCDDCLVRGRTYNGAEDYRCEGHEDELY